MDQYQFEEIKASLSEIKIQLAKLDQFKEMTEKHERTIYGNGQEGLTSKVNGISRIEGELRTHTNSDRWMFGIIISLLLATVGKLFLK